MFKAKEFQRLVYLREEEGSDDVGEEEEESGEERQCDLYTGAVE